MHQLKDIKMHIHAIRYTYLLTIVFYMPKSIGLTNRQIISCDNTAGNFTKNSTYDKNRNAILSSLAFDVKANDGLYYSSEGEDPDKIYVVAGCSGDSSLEECVSCVNATALRIMTQCPNQKEAISWVTEYPQCTVRYANRTFYGIVELDPGIIWFNMQQITMTVFDQIWRSVMDRTLTNASMGSSRLKFATGEENFTAFQKIYAMVQCFPDLNQTNCAYCLRRSVTDYITCCRGRAGGTICRPSCNIRWELYPFYNVTADAPTPYPSTAVRPPQSTEGSGNGRHVAWIVIVATVSTAILVLSGYFFFFPRMWKRYKEKRAKRKALQLLRLEDECSHDNFRGELQVESQEFPLFTLGQILEAAKHFSNENKLGEGGFGPVYRGVLADGKEIAVKRLSRSSGQGLKEFKNEVTLIAKLQHKNLVRLLGCCLEGNELLLVYEYMTNKSLDLHLFDSTSGMQLDWKKRISIVNGIARGLLYLHEDSRLKIIHRDLKTSNILLDHEMNPKISDFGMARIFGGNQSKANTNRVVGTYGYMAPEYAMEGMFSVKSDVFSFGVVLLEIISGRKNTGFYQSEHGRSLLAYAWKLWCEGQAVELMDPVLVQSCDTVELLKLIHIGLLCVQEDPADRPIMSYVVLMMGCDPKTLPNPKQPAFSASRVVEQSNQSSSDSKGCSVNGVTLSNVSPR